jgi:outer membrane putative beta-barrel porin/alpha-amylase
VYNIQKAVSRLDYAPKLKEIEITDIKKGLGEFTPKPDKPVSFAALKKTLKSAGYVLASADITLAGTLNKEGDVWIVTTQQSGQKFFLEGANVQTVVAGAEVGSPVEITGEWKTMGQGAGAREVVSPAQKTQASARFIPAKFIVATESAEPAKPVAPIRVTSPGLTVYKGGAITPRLYLIRQSLGALKVNRQMIDVSVSYTPSARVQLEAEVPISRTSFHDGVTSGSGTGLGNITVWTKYRFFRRVKTYGDRQAAARFGLELPTGKNDAPDQNQINVPAFVRQQLTPINGGLSPHFDLAFSQAGGRFIFGGNAEAIFRSERDGFRMGHEQRLNTDLEYVLLPREYKKPGGELFVIMETTFVHRGTGRLNSAPVAGSKATEYYLAPGLQYAARPRFVVEGSVQFPVVRNTGPLSLRTDVNVLLGVKYLF